MVPQLRWGSNCNGWVRPLKDAGPAPGCQATNEHLSGMFQQIKLYYHLLESVFNSPIIWVEPTAWTGNHMVSIAGCCWTGLRVHFQPHCHPSTSPAGRWGSRRGLPLPPLVRSGGAGLGTKGPFLAPQSPKPTCPPRAKECPGLAPGPPFTRDGWGWGPGEPFVAPPTAPTPPTPGQGGHGPSPDPPKVLVLVWRMHVAETTKMASNLCMQ